MKYKLLFLYLLIYSSSIVNADSPQLKYSTFLGIFRDEGASYNGGSIAADVDDEGNFYVLAPQTIPPDTTWPLYPDKGGICRLLRISPDGSDVDLVMTITDSWEGYSVLCHPSGYIYLECDSDIGRVIKKITPEGEEIGQVRTGGCHYIDSFGNLYIAGSIHGGDNSIPITENAMFGTFIGGQEDIFLLKYDSTLTNVYGSFLGGTDSDRPSAIIGNADGNILLSCEWLSGDFQYLPDDYGSSRAVLVFTPALDEIVSGSRKTSLDIYPRGRDTTYDASSGSIFDVGGGVVKFSSDGDFQWVSGVDGSEPFVRNYKPAERSYSSMGISIDESGCIYYTLDVDDKDFPVTADAIQTHKHLYDITVTRLDHDGNHEYATYFGGSGFDRAPSLASACKNGVFYCAGVTTSYDFPVTADAYLNQKTSVSGNYDLFAFAIDFNDFTVNVAEESSTVPTPLILDPPHPNPFNPATTISYTLPEAGFARLAIYNISGQLVRELTADNLPAGRHEFVWDGRDTDGAPAGSGVYIARLAAGERTAVRKVTLVR